jgi:hypothetical protein
MRLVKLTVMLSLVTLALAACGGGDDGEDGGTTAGAGDGGAVVDGPIDAARCAEVVGAMAAAAQAVPAAMTGGGGDLGTSVEQLEAFANEAPEEIRDDLVLIAQAYAEIAQVWADAGFDPTSGEPPSPETLAALQAAGDVASSQEFQAASDRVSAWFQSECGT